MLLLLPAPLQGRQLYLSVLSLRGGWGSQPGPEPHPLAPPTHASVLPLPGPLCLLGSSLQNLPSRTSFLSICCLDCSQTHCLTGLYLIAIARWWLHPPNPHPTVTELGPGRAPSLEPQGSGRGRPEGPGTRQKETEWPLGHLGVIHLPDQAIMVAGRGWGHQPGSLPAGRQTYIQKPTVCLQEE